MAEYIIMPKLGFDMDKGTIMKWLVREGDLVKEQDEILEIETDKTVMPVEAQTSGILRKILVAEGEEVPVTLPIAIIGDKDEDISKMIEEAYQKLGKSEIIEEKSKADREVPPVIEESQEIKSKKEKEKSKKDFPKGSKKGKRIRSRSAVSGRKWPRGSCDRKRYIRLFSIKKRNIQNPY